MKRKPDQKKRSDHIRKIVVYNRFLDTLGGGELSTILLASKLSELFVNAEVRIVTFDSDINEYGKVKVASRRELEKAFGISLPERINVLRVATGMEALLGRIKGLPAGLRPRYMRLPFLALHLFMLKKELKKISAGADIFINHTFRDEFRPSSALNVYFCMFPQVPRNRGFHKAYARVIGISEFTLRHIRSRWGREGSLLYPFALNEIPEYRPFEERENIILNVGRFFREGHNKKQDVIIRAFKALKDKYGAEGWKLVLIGRYAEKDRGFVDELKKESEGYDVAFLTDLSDAEKKAYLDKAKVYVHATGFGTSEEDFPERMEHFGITVVEAKTHGLVPVVINRGAMGELVRDGFDGFSFDTIDGLVEKLNACVKGASLKELSRNAYRSSIERFSASAFREALRQSLQDFFVWGDSRKAERI